MGNTAAFKQHPKLKDYVSWFEIPAFDIQRATAFYNAIYNMEMEHSRNGEFAMAYFPVDKGIGGAIIQGPGCYPNDTGVLIYLNAGNDIDSILGRIELAGGRIIMPKTLISDASGSFALFLDSEGNRLALHEGPMRPAAARKEEKPVRKSAPSARTSTPKKAAKRPAVKKKK